MWLHPWLFSYSVFNVFFCVWVLSFEQRWLSFPCVERMCIKEWKSPNFPAFLHWNADMCVVPSSHLKCKCIWTQGVFTDWPTFPKLFASGFERLCHHFVISSVQSHLLISLVQLQCFSSEGLLYSTGTSAGEKTACHFLEIVSQIALGYLASTFRA